MNLAQGYIVSGRVGIEIQLPDLVVPILTHYTTNSQPVYFSILVCCRPFLGSFLNFIYEMYFAAQWQMLCDRLIPEVALILPNP